MYEIKFDRIKIMAVDILALRPSAALFLITRCDMSVLLAFV